ncbi:MAG: hypothetical protein II023_09165 [Prevotella sp.]|nr:hypothetical protein [Prevotella sp.]
MERKQYIVPMAKVLEHRFSLLNPTMPVGSDPNDDPMEGKGTLFMDEDEQNNAWGRVWER